MLKKKLCDPLSNQKSLKELSHVVQEILHFLEKKKISGLERTVVIALLHDFDQATSCADLLKPLLGIDVRKKLKEEAKG